MLCGYLIFLITFSFGFFLIEIQRTFNSNFLKYLRIKEFVWFKLFQISDMKVPYGIDYLLTKNSWLYILMVLQFLKPCHVTRLRWLYV
jgi:hypothetical protein